MGAALIDVYFISELAHFFALLLGSSVVVSDISKSIMSQTLSFDLYIIFLMLLAGFSYTAVLGNSWLIIYGANALGAVIGNDSVRRFLATRSLVDAEANADYTRRLILDDAHRIVSGIYVPLYNFIARAVLVASFLIYLILESPSLTVLAFVILASYLSSLNLVMKRLVMEPSRRLTVLAGERIDRLKSIVDGHQYFNVFNRVGHFENYFSKKNTAYYKTKALIEFISTVPRLAIEGMIVIAVLLFLLFGATGVFSVDLTAISVFLLSIARIAPALQQAFSLALQARSHFPVFEDLIAAESLVVAEHDGGCPLDIFEEKDHLLISSLSVSFRDNHEIIYRDVKFERAAWTAIVGPSGLGKSTLLAYLSGYSLPPTRTTATRKGAVREPLGYGLASSQFVIKGSLLENIFLDLEMKTPTEFELGHAYELLCDVELAAELNVNECSLSEFEIDSSGSGLSVGQIQRLSLVRAFVNNPEVVLLDEPTSALNDDLTKRVFKKLRERFGNTTVICVTHAEIILPFFDRCIELDKKVEVTGHH